MTRLTILFQFGIILLINSCGGQDSPFDSAKKSIDKKDYEAAIVMLNKIIEEKPNFDSAYIERGYAYMMIGDTRSAFDDYNHVISNPFLKINALDGRAQLYYTTGEYQKSLDDFSKIIKLDRSSCLTRVIC